MKYTLTELHRETEKVLQPVKNGSEVLLTEEGKPVARLSPACEHKVVSAEVLRSSAITDQAILEAIAEARS